MSLQERYNTDALFRAHVQLWGLVGVLWFLVLIALMFIFGNSEWIYTGIVLLVTMLAIALLKENFSSDDNMTMSTIAVIFIGTVLTILVSELLSPERSIQEHLTTLVNPYWTILIFFWLSLRKTTYSSNQEVSN